MPDKEWKRQPVPCRGCHVFSDSDLNTNKTCVAAGRAGTLPAPAFPVQQRRALRRQALEARETDGLPGQYIARERLCEPRLDIAVLRSNGWRSMLTTRTGPRPRNWSQHLGREDLRPRSKSEKDS